MLSAIVAMDLQGGIGKNGKIPWKLSEDLRYFKRMTLGETIVVGRKTQDSIGKVLPDRQTIVLSKTLTEYPGCQVIQDPQLLVNSRVMVCGGADVYRFYLPFCDRLFVTLVYGDFQCDTFFPLGSPFEGWHGWEIISSASYKANTRNSHNYTFFELTRICHNSLKP